MPNYVTNAQASELLHTANRILVVGCSGGGKTTLSLKISKRRNLDYVSIDRDVRWLPGWNAREKDAQRALISNLVRKDSWVMDGSGASSFDLRLPRTNLVLWVRVPRSKALQGLALRVLRNFGSVREAMPEGCPEKLPNREFLSYVWNFEKKHAPLFVEQIDRYGPKIPVAILKSHSDINELLDRHSET